MNVNTDLLLDSFRRAGIVGLIWVLLAGAGLAAVAGDHPLIIWSVSMLLFVMLAGLIMVDLSRLAYSVISVAVVRIREKTNPVSKQTKPPAATAL